MKKLFQIISVTIVTVILTTTLVGCNPFDNGSTAYLTQKMDEIPIEFDGYELVASDMAPWINGFSGQVEIKGAVLELQDGYEIDNNYYDGYLLKYSNKTIYINDEFMRRKNETYVKISRVWSGFNNCGDIEYESNIMTVYPFDGHLFIVTDGIIRRLATIDVRGCIPITLYMLDLDTWEVYYSGYYPNYSNDNASLKIVKRG